MTTDFTPKTPLGRHRARLELMLSTPDTRHVKDLPYRDCVYEPAEDTFALLDALEQDGVELKQVQPRLIVEIGSGSGCVSAFTAELLGQHSALFVCADVNEVALQCSNETAAMNGKRFDAVQTDLLGSLLTQCAGKVDLLLFNPPYVPTSTEEEQLAQRQASLSGSWAGGTLGINLLNRLLPQLDRILAPKGRFYFVAIAQNDPTELVKRLAHVRADVCLSRRAGREHLFIIRVVNESRA